MSNKSQSGTLLNIWTEENTYKTAKCKGCFKKLIQGELIIGMSRTQGSFTSVSNYHPSCAKEQMLEDSDSVAQLMKNLLDVMTVVEKKEQETQNIDNIYKEATANFKSTLENLGNG